MTIEDSEDSSRDDQEEPRQKTPYGQRAFAWFKRTLTIVFVCYFGAIIVLVSNESRLVYPGRSTAYGDWNPQGFEVESVEFQSSDGTLLHGWYLSQPEATRNVVIFHGNAENVATVTSAYGRRLSHELNANVFLFDYRGFGRSTGRPTEQGVIEDGIAAVRWLEERSQQSASTFLFYGSSLGGGVAVAVAEKTQAKMLLLDRTFSSLVQTAAVSYPWVPVSWLMKNRFPSSERIQDFPGAVFISHFVDDELIPLSNAENLFAAATTSRKEFLRLPGGHHLAKLPEEYWQRLVAFVDQHE